VASSNFELKSGAFEMSGGKAGSGPVIATQTKRPMPPIAAGQAINATFGIAAALSVKNPPYSERALAVEAAFKAIRDKHLPPSQR